MAEKQITVTKRYTLKRAGVKNKHNFFKKMHGRCTLNLLQLPQ